MIKKGIYIVILLLFGVIAEAQIVAPMGYGLPAAPEKISSYNDGIITVYANNNNEVELQVWNGDFWYKIKSPQLPKVGTNSNGIFRIVDLVEYSKNIYLCAAYESKTSGIAKNYILQWDGENWTDLSNSIVANSSSLDKLVIQDNNILCIGKFEDQNAKYNVIKLDNSNWKAVGNLITKNSVNDKFSSIAVGEDKIYATGKFTAIQSGNFSLATWDGVEWEIAEFPPFLGENIVVGEYNNNIVVYGTSNFSNETVKIKSGNLWANMSQGLEKFTVQNISNFAELNGSLFAVGEFESASDNKSYNILEYDGSSWNTTNLYLSDIEQLYTEEKSVIVSGDFSDNARINFIGKIYKDQAQIAARVYHDKNGNCTKDSDEDWMPNFPITLNKTIDHLNTDKFGQLYLPIDKTLHTINASDIDFWQPTCPDYIVNASESKTYYGAILGVKQKIGVQDGLVYITDNQSYNAQESELKTAQIVIKNKSVQPITGAILTLSHTSNVSNFSSEVPFDSYLNNTAKWEFDLNGNETFSFNINYTASNNENLILDANFKLREGEVDENLENNSSSIRYKNGSTTPNYKNCANGKTIYSDEDVLTYKIGFQNLGLSEAIDIKVVDEIDTDYDYNLIEAYTSHTSSLLPVFTKMSNGEYKTKLIWTFSDINIPNAESDPQNSKGFVDILVYNKPLSVGSEICNTAKIYYSYRKGTFSEPIFTNTVCSEVVETGTTGSNQLPNQIEGLEIGPNPVKDKLVLNNNTKSNYSIQVSNTIGQIVGDFDLKSLNKTIFNVSNLPKGVYFLYAEGVFVHKFVVQ